jgi:protein-L-isoaspartate(D-aspartate) O-methyltransferase
MSHRLLPLAGPLPVAVLSALLLVPSGCDRDSAELREVMVREQIEGRGVHDPRVLAAMRDVARHEFVADAYQRQAYQDAAVPIGEGQTTPQPYVVALMAESLGVEPGDRVLEIGTGSGYQAAVLAAMGAEVFTIEIRPRLCKRAADTLAELGYQSVHVRCGDGWGGWPEEAPFDGIVVTAAPEDVPAPLFDQLGDGATMVIPVGTTIYQQLKVITRTGDGFEERSAIPVHFGEIDRGADGATSAGSNP